MFDRANPSRACLSKPSSAIALLLLLTPLAPPLTLPAQTPDLEVKYTGRLFGYYRIEPDESVSAAPAPGSGIRLSTVRAFLGSLSSHPAQRPDAPQTDTLLLGMGDNFAPEFGASIQQEFRTADGNGPCESRVPDGPPTSTTGEAEWHRSAPEALYKTETRMPVQADCDNVLRLLMTAGYRAVVPGREDFIYSATWLRRIAYLLRGASPGNAANPSTNPLSANGLWKTVPIESFEHRLHMLGANLRVKVSEDSCPLLFSADLASKDHPCLKGDGTMTAEMDWLRRMDQTLTVDASGAPGTDATAPVVVSMNRQARQSPEFREQLLINQASIVSALLAGYNCQSSPKDLAALAKPDAYKLSPGNGLTLTANDQAMPAAIENALNGMSCGPQTADLAASVRNLVAKIKAGTGPTPPDAATTILMDLESRIKADTLTLGLVLKEQRDIGYTIARLTSGRRALVIGVVGKETMQEISCVNFEVYPDRVYDGNLARTAGGSSPCPKQKEAPQGPAFPVVVGDPEFAVSAILRAAWEARAPANPETCFDTVVVMAQMPSAEAGELGEQVRAEMGRLYAKGESRPSIDLILSEAQYGHESPNFEMHIEPGGMTPVLVPPDGSVLWQENSANLVSTASLSTQPDQKHPELTRLLVNSLPALNPPPTDPGSESATGTAVPTPDNETAASLLREALKRALGKGSHDADLDAVWTSCGYDDFCRNTALMQYLLRQLQRSTKADIVFLERRDFYFGWLGHEYADDSFCDRWVAGAMAALTQGQASPAPDYRKFYTDYCHLKVALDRVLWKGDFSERVMVDGATLTTLMKTAEQQTDQEQTLLARDLSQEWLVTYGVVTRPPTNLTAAASGPETFSVPGSDGCNNTGSKSKASNAANSPYCVDGQSILSDHAYWLTTSDQLAQDNAVYTALSSFASKSGYAAPTNRLYLTSEIADEVTRRGQTHELAAHGAEGSAGSSTPAGVPAETELASVETRQQDRDLIQLDFSKLVAGYTLTSPSLTDADLAAEYSGVSNTQAVTPHSQELDLEAASRLVSAPVFGQFVLGAQTDAEYDRRALGNLSGNPETVTYSANSYSAGGFVQRALHSKLVPGLTPSGVNRSTRNLPRAFLVLAPYQFQRQLSGAFLNFAFFTPPNTTNSQQQVTVHLPTAMGFSQRAGFRYEFAGVWRWTPDPGSYYEFGPEYSVQNNVLSAILMPQLSSTAVCDALATQSIQTCVKNAYKAAGATLNAASTLTPVTQTLHAGGFYWMVHVQKVVDKEKNYTVSFDTQGDNFVLPGATLTTQTRYAFSTKLALNFKIAGNLSLSPTWSDFFFENQGISSQRTSLVATTFAVSAKWYFARDAQVPFRKQLWFVGPASSDQTGTAKIK
ncbi:MAG: hypothetical protein WBE72_24805 [Terracidiphilus sp.]